MWICTAAAIIALSVWTGGAQDTARAGIPDSAAQARMDLLERSILAPCCYKEPISRHRSDIATKMKVEVARWVAEGRSDDEILGAYREQYGARVVIPPEPDPSPWIRIVPWLAAIGGALLVIRMLARWRRHGARGWEAPVTQ